MTFVRCCECGAKLPPEALQLPADECFCPECAKRFNLPPHKPIK